MSCWRVRFASDNGEVTMGFGQAIAVGFANYFNFRTRASRSKYWYFILFLVIVSVALSILELAIDGSREIFVLSAIFSLATLIPSLSAFVRRLHDIGRSGWWVLLGLIPIVGIIVLLYWACQPTVPQQNQYGPPPGPMP